MANSHYDHAFTFVCIDSASLCQIKSKSSPLCLNFLSKSVDNTGLIESLGGVPHHVSSLAHGAGGRRRRRRSQRGRGFPRRRRLEVRRTRASKSSRASVHSARSDFSATEVLLAAATEGNPVSRSEQTINSERAEKRKETSNMCATDRK